MADAACDRPGLAEGGEQTAGGLPGRGTGQGALPGRGGGRVARRRARVAELAGEGLRPAEIARALGMTADAVHTHLSRLRLGPERRASRVIGVRLDQTRIERLQAEADARGATPGELALRLLTLVLDGALVAAVLDDEGAFA